MVSKSQIGNHIQKNEIIVFTDGACSNNGKQNSKCSIGVHFPNKQFQDISEIFPYENHTNQRAELYAIIKALYTILHQFQDILTTNSPSIKNKFYPQNITIYTDSKYCCNIINHWLEKWIKEGKEMKNWDLILILQSQLQYVKKHSLTLIVNHCKGHQKIKKIPLTGHDIYNNFIIQGNNAADLLAKKSLIDNSLPIPH